MAGSAGLSQSLVPDYQVEKLDRSRNFQLIFTAALQVMCEYSEAPFLNREASESNK
jgi:hypothetical protein